jgi:arsenate reductase
MPQRLTQTVAEQASLLVTMGCGDECPYVPGLAARRLAARGNPAGQPLERVRAIRDDIRHGFTRL